MASQPTALERAFSLARTGDYDLDGIRAQLKAERHDVAQIQGPSLIRQLREICAASRAAKADTPPAE